MQVIGITLDISSERHGEQDVLIYVHVPNGKVVRTGCYNLPAERVAELAYIAAAVAQNLDRITAMRYVALVQLRANALGGTWAP